MTAKINILLLVVGITLGACFTTLAMMDPPTRNQDERVILGHRVGPDGNVHLVYAD